MNCVCTNLGDEVRLEISGALDALTVPQIRPVVDSLLSEGPQRVIVDIGSVTLLDSSGAGAMVSLFKGLKGRWGNMALIGAQAQPLAVLKPLRLDRVFDL